ncbi:RING finger and transmembrane domain-containing protein 2 [Operophtera brumata]|uniref:RING finger and transmembrane domain-containing protein 2 n=1 Tax=Operophtera brumata TaxID=104452 RepID=A0A0L7LQW9_OPEBR|nr:RING finger and transmembrane domain-containing protein 2 [Operophtera brumata]
MSQSHQVTLDIDDEEPSDATPRTSTFSRLEPPTREPRVPPPVPPHRSNLGLGDRLNSVFREIRPLVENARMGNNARLSLPTWLPRNTPGTHHTTDTDRLQRPHSSIAHVNLGPNAQTYVITERGTQTSFDAGMGMSPEANTPDVEELQDINVSVNPANNNNIHDNADNESLSDDGTQQTLNVLIRYAPFYLILFLKFLYDSREGIFAFIILFSMFVHCNGLVRREHGKQTNRSIRAMLSEIFYTVCCIFVVQVLFGHEKLLPNVVMFPAYTQLDVWELIWLVSLTDLMAKIITVDFKLLITMMPACLLPFQKRGKVYLFTEAVSQLYRSLLTIQPWVFFLMQAYEGSERILGMFLTTVYVIAKLLEVLMRLRLFKNATWTLLQSVNLGTKPTNEQLSSAGESCPVCHDAYSTPVRLGCGHIYCELCISAWLDREHTCPLCRAKVADEPLWRDGSTTYDFQLY